MSISKTPKKKGFDCVKFMHDAQRDLRKEFEARKNEFRDYADFINKKSFEIPEVARFLSKMRQAPTTSGAKRPADTISRLKENCGSHNFVYVVGYALERVHTGAMAFAVNQFGAPVVVRFWKHANNQEVSVEAISNISVQREAKAGKGSVADIVVSFDLEGRRHNIVSEYKVDGFGKMGNHGPQCGRLAQAWTDSHGGERNAFALVTLGDSRFTGCSTPSLRFGNIPQNFCHLSIDHILDILGPFQQSEIIYDYMTALKDESQRGALDVSTVPEKSFQAIGYRTDGECYAWYSQLRQRFSRPQDWSIYNAVHNPVMCWNPAWIQHDRTASNGNLTSLGRLYCEFNYYHFTLKISWAEGAKDKNRIYAQPDRVYAAVSADGMTPSRRHNLNGDSALIAKNQWDSPLSQQSVAKWINDFVPSRFAAISNELRDFIG